MESHKKFETKLGYCHVLPDRLILTEESTLKEHLAEYEENNKLPKIMIAQLLLVVLFAIKGYMHFENGKLALTIGYGIAVLLFAIILITNRNNTATPLLRKESIKKITLKKGIKGFTRPHFIVYYRTNKGATKKRFIMLPGALFKGEVTYQKAIDILTKEHYLTT